MVLYKAIRAKMAGVWQPWEWVNPPMVPGVEYRTTKRHNGKPVYTHCREMNTDLTEADGYKSRWFTHLDVAAGMDDIISWSAKIHPIGLNSNLALPAGGADGCAMVNVFTTGFSIYSTKPDNIDYAWVAFEYTKS